MSYTIAKGVYSSAALDIARSSVTTSSTFSDYLFFRTSDTDYFLLIGDIDFDTFSYTDCQVFQISHIVNSQIPISAPDNYWAFQSVGTSSGVVLNPDHNVFYSSNVKSPQLVDRGGAYLALASFFSILVFFFVYIFNSLFANVSRR